MYNAGELLRVLIGGKCGGSVTVPGESLDGQREECLSAVGLDWKHYFVSGPSVFISGMFIRL